MSQEIINVGPAPNDGLGDPIRTAFIKCNNNFGQLFSRAQPYPPVSLVGSPGDQAGMYAYDSTYFYYCFENYDGSSIIWAQVTQIGNVSVSSINNGNSNVVINGAGGNISVAVNGTSNIITASNALVQIGTNTVISGTLSTDGITSSDSVTVIGNITGQYFIGNGSYLSGVSTYSNANVASFLTSYTGELSAGNVSVTGDVSATGNLTATYFIGDGSQLTGLPASYGNANVAAYLPTYNGNLSANIISTTGNIQCVGGIFIGNGSGLTGVIATGNVGSAQQIGNGSTVFGIPIANGNIIGNIGGITNVYELSTVGLRVSGTVTGNVISSTGDVIASGNVSALNSSANNYTAGAVIASRSVVGANFSTAGNVVAIGNVQAGNLRSSGTLSVSGNSIVTNLSASLVTSGAISSTGNVDSLNLNTSGRLVATGNVYGQNIITGGVVSALGNITAANIVLFSTANISAGNLSLSGAVTAGNISTTGNITAGYSSVTGNSAATYFIGDGGLLSNINNANITGAYSNANVDNYLPVYTGNIAASYFIGNGSLLTSLNGSNISGTVANSTYSVNSGTAFNVSVSNISGLGTGIGNFLTSPSSSNLASAVTDETGSGALVFGTSPTLSSPFITNGILNADANGVGNIGNSSSYFNTVFAKATSAQYADVAENYLADAAYPPGTVLCFGGEQEVTISSIDHDITVIGIVSTQPAYCMNSTLKGTFVSTIALLGRIPCLVQGPIKRGDMLVSAGNGRARAERDPQPGSILGKALRSFDGTEGIIEIVVGRL